MMFFLKPVFVFFFTWISYFIIYILWWLYDSNLPIIGEYTILYILTVSFFWLIGSFVGRLLSLKIKNFFSPKSLFTEKNYIRLVFIIPIFYLFFRILDIFLITGNYSLNYENLALYRAILTTGINTVSNFFFFSFFNNLFFFLPCITFYYLLNKNITIFQIIYYVSCF